MGRPFEGDPMSRNGFFKFVAGLGTGALLGPEARPQVAPVVVPETPEVREARERVEHYNIFRGIVNLYTNAEAMTRTIMPFPEPDHPHFSKMFRYTSAEGDVDKSANYSLYLVDFDRHISRPEQLVPTIQVSTYDDKIHTDRWTIAVRAFMGADPDNKTVLQTNARWTDIMSNLQLFQLAVGDPFDREPLIDRIQDFPKVPGIWGREGWVDYPEVDTEGLRVPYGIKKTSMMYGSTVEVSIKENLEAEILVKP